MPTVYVDSAFYIALLNDSDDHYQQAHLIGQALDGELTQHVTTHAVIFEVLAYFARLGSRARGRAVELVQRVTRSAAVEVVATSEDLFERALVLYNQRRDKRYSLTDCLGMVICREREITNVLTSDRDFEAEGFTILLKS